MDKLIAKVTKDSKLVASNPDKQYKLETDTLNFTLGAVLFQRDKWEKWQAVRYASKTLTEAEHSYNIWDKEFLGLIFGLTKWWYYVMCTKKPVLAFIDHVNLAYYWHL